MHWIKADSSDFGGNLPHPRSGHTAVNVGKSKVVVFGGFVDRRFVNDVAVYDTENRLWFTPECTGSGSDGQVGPSPRAFHVAVAIDCHMFIFGGRAGSKRLGDFWMLDTDIWQWSELTSYGDLPSAREFAATSAIGNRKIVMYGGWDGKKWLSDVYILDTISLEWTELSVSGSVPPPRCGHTATMVEKRLLVFGGRGGGGPIMGDLWALKGLIDEGWLSRYDIYHNDCIVLDRVSVQWKRLPTSNEPPPARAYHSMTCIGSRYLLFGGFDGKSTFGDLWWLVPEDDPIAKRFSPTPPNTLPESKPVSFSSGSPQSIPKESQSEQSLIAELQKRLGISVSSSKVQVNFIDELDDKELLELSSSLADERLSINDQVARIQVLRDRWKKCTASSIQLRELGPLLRDYQRLIIRNHLENVISDSPAITSSPPGQEFHRYFHVKTATQLRMDDISKLLTEYKQLISS